MTIYLIYAAIFGLTAVLSYGAAPRLIGLSFKLNWLDQPGELKRHAHPMPFLGGVSIFFAFWSVVLIGLVGAPVAYDHIALFTHLPPLFNNITPWLPKIGGVFLGSVIVLILGIADDLYDLSPWPKLMVQSLVAVILLALGLRVNIFEVWGVAGYAVTFFWIILLMNAFNFIDSIDGHCLGVAFTSSLFFFGLTILISQSAIALFVIAFSGALFGLLPFNFKPARMFLGDNGSLQIGYMMSVLTLLCTYRTSDAAYFTPFIPVLMFGVPIYDTLSVIFVRLIRGQAPWKGDRNHFAHRLVRLGMGERSAVLFSYFVVITLGLVAILSTQVRTLLGNILIVVLFCAIIGIIAFLEYYAAVQIRRMEELAKHQRRRSTDSKE